MDYSLEALMNKDTLRPELTKIKYSPFDVELEVHLLAVGIRVGLAPIEVIDWLGGWFFLDLMGDDARR